MKAVVDFSSPSFWKVPYIKLRKIYSHLLGAFAKLLKATSSHVMHASLRPSVSPPGATWLPMDFH
jgi:hypothetical protein